METEKNNSPGKRKLLNRDQEYRVTIRKNEKHLSESIDLNESNIEQEIQIGDTIIHYPFNEVQESQVGYMEHVIKALNSSKHALLQSPTGTGKTINMLSATLAWLRKHKQDLYKEDRRYNREEEHIQIIYASRTHSQLQQVVKAIKSTCYTPRISVLGSKEQCCVNPQINKLKGESLKSACKAAGLAQDRAEKCSYRENYKLNKTAIQLEYIDDILDIEELKVEGAKEKICPYYLQRDLKDRADMILVPYNYLFDEDVLRNTKLNIARSIIIFDEGHNILNAAEEGSSIHLSIRNLIDCENEINTIRDKIFLNEHTNTSLSTLQNLERLISTIKKNLFSQKDVYLQELQSRNFVTEPYQDVSSFFDMIEKLASFNSFSYNYYPFANGIITNADDFSRLTNSMDSILMDLKFDVGSNGGFEKFSKFIKKARNLLCDSEYGNSQPPSSYQTIKESYIMHQKSSDTDNFTISLSCILPRKGIQHILAQKPRAMLITSGTLTPFNTFNIELKHKFLITYEGGHVINTKTQCYTTIVRKGPSGNILDFSQKSNNQLEMLKDIGLIIIKTAKRVPNGMLVCFKSYKQLEDFKIMAKEDDKKILRAISEHKSYYFETKDSGDLKKLMHQYEKDARDKAKGAILFCVCRGKLSEGIDFTDELARAVIMVGVPYPYFGDAKVQGKMKMLDNRGIYNQYLSGDQWYTTDAMRAVNQAIGRVIRNKNDFGIIVLCGDRYASDDLIELLPRWVKDNLEIKDQFDNDLKRRIKTFFEKKSRSLNSSPMVSEKSSPSRSMTGRNFRSLQSSPSKGKGSQSGERRSMDTESSPSKSSLSSFGGHTGKTNNGYNILHLFPGGEYQEDKAISKSRKGDKHW